MNALRWLLLAVFLPACRTGPETSPAVATTTTTESKPLSVVGEPELVSFPNGSLTLHGYLYKPTGAGPFPAIVFNHGSEELPGKKEGQAAFFVPHGYALFVPHRRGHGRSHDAGEYIGKIAEEGPKLIAALDTQAEDVAAAIAWLATQPFVDAKRIAVTGCSFGGIQSLLAAEGDAKIVAAVDFAGGAAMWKRTPLLQERMKTAARGARVPVFFIQAENDFDTTPSRVLDAEMRAAKKPSRIHIFPPNGTSPQEGHGFCAGGEKPRWGPEVLEFLESNMKR